MNREDIIKKWLDNNLNAEEQKAFEQLEDYKDLTNLDGALKKFKAPEFSIDHNYENLKPNLRTTTVSNITWFKPLLKIAGILAICYGLYFYTTTLDTSINTEIAQQILTELPDESTVNLNANSKLVFNKSNWDNKRIVHLKGEAFFKVAKGQKFDVITDAGTVTVLGTEFKVKEREDYFEVVCYEGLVAVSINKEIVKLRAGNKLLIVDGKLIDNEREDSIQPNWLLGESSFKEVALKHIISELENQYNITIGAENIDTSRLFTGSFTHKNLDLALKSVTIPLHLSYSKSGTSIFLKRE
ncbi:FecR family protein [Winogradskyella sp. PE311]|uniref:FecR family protein n=1 Tax=Winogradskyella sp. PE311 TaxID=3366943 RepID=UPI00397F921C